VSVGKHAMGEEKMSIMKTAKTSGIAATILTISTGASAGFVSSPHVNIDLFTDTGSLTIFNPNFSTDADGASVFTGDGGLGQLTFGYTVRLSTVNVFSLTGGGGELDRLSLEIDITNAGDVALPLQLVVSAGLVNSFFGPTFIGTGAFGTLTDVFGGGASLSNVGDTAMVTPRIDGNLLPGAAVFPNPFNITAGAFGSVEFEQFNGLGPGGPFLPGPSEVLNDYAMVIRFTLGAGDRIELNSVFEIFFVPSPGAVALLVIAAAIPGRRRRD
jgi:hypothetical protein